MFFDGGLLLRFIVLGLKGYILFASNSFINKKNAPKKGRSVFIGLLFTWFSLFLEEYKPRFYIHKYLEQL